MLHKFRDLVECWSVTPANARARVRSSDGSACQHLGHMCEKMVVHVLCSSTSYPLSKEAVVLPLGFWTRCFLLPQTVHDRGGHLGSHRLHLRPLGVQVSSFKAFK